MLDTMTRKRPPALRDTQRKAVYKWEDRVVGGIANGAPVSIETARGMVNAIWAEMGLKFPPMVEALPANAKKHAGDAHRGRIRLVDGVESWIVLHELAHSMTSTYDALSAEHGPVYMGVYVTLLVKYLRMDREMLLKSLKEAGIAIDVDAKPVFID